MQKKAHNLEHNANKTVQEYMLDNLDKKILNILQEDNQMTNLELAETLHISPPSCLRRVRRLHELGIIAKNVALVDPVKIGNNLIVFVNITLEKQGQDLLSHFEHKMLSYEEIKQCYFISGDIDYLLVVHTRDIHSYNEFARKVFANEPNIKVYRSNFCLSRVKYNTSTVLVEDES